MRLNQFLALHTELSRRSADRVISDGQVTINGRVAPLGALVDVEKDVVFLKGSKVSTKTELTSILFNKPVGYVCSRNGQGSSTIYDILPEKYRHLNTVGRLDKESSGLILLTNNGGLANELTHPRYAKKKVYHVTLDKPLTPLHQQMISDFGIELEDGSSKLLLEKLDDSSQKFQVVMSEGRNRQIRRTFSALGYNVKTLNRIEFGNYILNDLEVGQFKVL